MSLITFSPSNLSQYRLCPKKFWGQQTKMIVWKETRAKARGTAVHEALEIAVKDGIKRVSDWPSGLNVGYVQDTVRTLRGIDGAKILTEHEMAVDKNFKSCGWWDGDAFLRAKADLLCLKPEEYALVGDWKTGKIYPDMDFQLRVEALLVHALYHVNVVSWMLFYVDQGQTKKGIVDFTQGFAQVQDILDLMLEAKKTMGQGGPYLAKKNQFCRWCDWYHTPSCQDSRGW